MDAKVFVNGQLASSTEMAWLVAAQVIIIIIIIGIIVIIHTPTPSSLFNVTLGIKESLVASGKNWLNSLSRSSWFYKMKKKI